MESSGCFNSGLDDNALKLYDDSERCTYNKCGSILTEQETSNIPDQTMPEFSFNGYTDAIETNGLAEGYDARFYMDYVFKQFEKEMEDRIETEFAEHKDRVFEILSNYKENLNCALEDNVTAAISTAPVISDSQGKCANQLSDSGSLPTEAEFQTASYSSEQAITDGCLGGSQGDIDHIVDRLLLEIACSCFQIYRELDNQLAP